MGEFQAFVAHSLRGQLKAPSDFRAHVYFLRESIEEFGRDALSVPGYTMMTGQVSKSDREEFLLKSGDWSSLWLEERFPGVFVIHERSG